MPRPIRAIFDRSALRDNLARARGLAPRSRIWAVVKADAYGHGLLRAASSFATADGFALLDLDDAVQLREAGVRKPILLLEGVFEVGDLSAVAEHGLSMVIHNAEQIDMLESAGLPARVPVYAKMNGGMNRLGFTPERYRAVCARLAHTSGVASVTLMTHFADADGAAGVAEDLARFDAATEGLALPRSMANSAALLRFAQTHGDWVRPGIMLYGCSPFADESAAALGLRPAMTLESELIAVQNLQAGDRVGYAGTFSADHSCRIGIVACGYADGYPRHAPTGTPVLVEGQRTRTVGRVSMDMLAVDLEPLPQAHVGSPVTLWGEGLSADEVASAAGTVSYEMLCALAPRVPQTDID
jgi:alanine racemase